MSGISFMRLKLTFPTGSVKQGLALPRISTTSKPSSTTTSGGAVLGQEDAIDLFAHIDAVPQFRNGRRGGAGARRRTAARIAGTGRSSCGLLAVSRLA